MVRNFLLSILLLIGVGCSSKKNSVWLEYRDLFAMGEYEKAEQFISKNETIRDPKDKLLILMEKGNLNVQLNRHKEAFDVFMEAIELVDAQYTKSVSEKAAKYLINDTKESFYGTLFERSWLHYYAAMASYRFYLTDPVKNREYLFKSRALMLSWDSFFQEIQRMSDNKTIYKHDLVAKIFAAQIHEVIGVRNDLQISLQLYRDALSLLKKWGGVFTSFNQDATTYLSKVQESLNDGKNLDEKNLALKKSTFYINTEKYLENKISELTKNKISTNVTLFFEEGMIPLKKARKINIGLKGAISGIKDERTRRAIEDVGAAIITHFAMEKLGLMPNPNNYQPGHFSTAYNVTNITAREAAIEFEVPVIEEKAPLRDYKIIIKDEKGKLIAQSDLMLVGDLGELSKLVLEEEAAQRTLRTGIRVAIKMVGAILAAYMVHKKLSNGNDNFIATSAALATFLGTSKALLASEKADIRAWATLPKSLRLAEFKLPEGIYEVELTANIVDPTTQPMGRKLGKLTVKGKDRTIFAYRSPQL